MAALPILDHRMDTPSRSSLAQLQARLPELMHLDRRRLQRRIDGVRNRRGRADQQVSGEVLDQIAADIDAAEQRLAARRAGVPTVRYPDELPVSQRRDDILAAIRDHQVVIVAGETGSGKTTQLPKMCLELGRGVSGLVGHTQPRRLAARTVAERIAEELDTPLGETVGWKVRFTDKVGDNTLVKVMTDGILLAEIQSDRMLRQYDTLIIDEAHERSLNIDFILGYVKQLLPRRPDLKVIITSATIDPERFSRHFGDAPIVEVSGRTYPVEVRYRPIVEDAEDRDRDQTQAILDAVDELSAEGDGDILVFLSGEREIRDTADALEKQNLPRTEIAPLYARLSAAEQHRVFQRHSGRRIVLATNVAETSLTVPGIRYVIDPGTARISRYSQRLKVQRLPIEAISQASANQRKGRCGRTSDGICIRLYAEDDFLARPEFTDPEILRTNLASVILAMTAAGLGDLAAFPFIDPPDSRNVKAGVQLLEELGALATGPAEDAEQGGAARPVEDAGPGRPGKGGRRSRGRGERGDGGNRLTPVGRTLSQLPVDPRLARMVVEAERNGCLREVMVIAAALSIQDPRERPTGKEEAATQQHARFVDKTSDFLTYLNLWDHLREQQRALSSNQFRRLCRNEFLNYLRVREWQDVESQLRQVAKSLGMTVGKRAENLDSDRIHQSLLAGLLSHIGLKDSEKKSEENARGSGRRSANDYLGARGARFAVFPGSALFKNPPQWVMAAELVETSRLWARIVARIEPGWVEELAGHLVKRNYSEPHWSKKQAAVLAYERVTLYGVPLVAQRVVNYGRIDAELSRELFIRHGLVEGDWETRHEFFHANRALLDEVEDLEDRARRRDILVDDDALFDFYDERVGKDVVSGAHFDSWWKKTRRREPDLLTFSIDMLVNESAEQVDETDYPDFWEVPGAKLRLTYQFEPGADADGVTVHIPLPILNQLRSDTFDWQIPGLRQELVTALIRSLPKPLRRTLVPAPDFARAALERMQPHRQPFLDSLEAALRQFTGILVPRESWDLDRVPDHLKPTFRVLDGRGRTLGEGRDLAALKEKLRGELKVTLAKAASGVERANLRSWDFEEVPAEFAKQRAGLSVRAYPALADAGDSAAIRLFESEADARRAMWAGTRRLLLLNLPSPVKYVLDRQSYQTKLALSHSPHGSAAALFDDCLACAVDKLMADNGGPVRDRAGFDRLRDAVRADLHDTVADTVARVADILAVAHELDTRLRRTSNPLLLPAMTDVKAQLAGLVFPGFVTETGWRRLPDVVRYLRAIDRRLDKVGAETHRDAERMRSVQQVQEAYEQARARLSRDARVSGSLSAEAEEGLREIRWMIEELRVSYFAQVLGTPGPISDKRILKAIDRLTG
ncbi:ATP-dependent RNA helicase HrpA [Actinopolymorpha rutila]